MLSLSHSFYLIAWLVIIIDINSFYRSSSYISIFSSALRLPSSQATFYRYQTPAVFDINRILLPTTIHQHLSTSSRQAKDFSLNAGIQPFNPFTTRRKNSRVRWFENDLEEFYAFVESQPLLSVEQEFKYGKALRMWFQIEKIRERMQLDAAKNAMQSDEGASNQTLVSDVSSSMFMTQAKYPVSDEDLAASLGCSVATLSKMSKYAEISKIKLVNGNMKLVMAIVSRYRTSSIPNSELIAEGVRGLAKAVVRYDYSRGFRFATYATWYIHQAVAEYVRVRKHPTKMPSRYLLLLRKVKQFSTEYKVENSRLPTINEISTALKESQFDITKVLSMGIYPTLLNSPVTSRSGSFKDGKDRTMEDFVQSGTVDSPIKAPSINSASRDLRHTMERMMECHLNDVERDILRLRLGLDDGREKAVKEVGRHFKISWKQVRSVERNALSKLSTSSEMPDFVSTYHDSHVLV